jgi:regulator of sigma E protease
MIVNFLLTACTVLGALALFSLTIFMHELGHFLFARWRGLVVEEFAVGLGPVIFSRRINGVPWNFRAVPFGGYVKLPQLVHMEMIEGQNAQASEDYRKAGAWDKIWAAFGGPLFSALFGCLLAVVVWQVGRPVLHVEATPVIGHVLKDGPAAKATPPLQPGDRILAIDGRRVSGFLTTPYSIVEAVAFSTGAQVHFEFERTQADGTAVRMSTDITPTKDEDGRRKVMIGPEIPVYAGTLRPGSPFEKAGMRPGDHIVRVAGLGIHSPDGLGEALRAPEGGQYVVTVQRDGRRWDLNVAIPPFTEEEYRSGAVAAGLETLQPIRRIIKHSPPWTLVWDSLVAVKRTVGALVDHRSDIKLDDMAGPIGILHNTYNQLSFDFRRALWFMVILNVNLALLNLLPIPIVDGGHILLAALEGIRRRPLPSKAVEYVSYACAALLISVMLYITSFDVRRLVKYVAEEMRLSSTETNAAKNARP